VKAVVQTALLAGVALALGLMAELAIIGAQIGGRGADAWDQLVPAAGAFATTMGVFLAGWRSLHRTRRRPGW
jgi:hypothetical protein